MVSVILNIEAVGDNSLRKGEPMLRRCIVVCLGHLDHHFNAAMGHGISCGIAFDFEYELCIEKKILGIIAR